MNFFNELIKNVVFKGVNVILSFIITILFIRLLGTEGNGIYSLFNANITIIALVISFSLNSGITYYIAKNKFQNNALFNTIIFISILQVLIILILEKIFRTIFGFSFYLDINFPGLSLWGTLFVLAVLFNGYSSSMFAGKKWFDNLNIISVCFNVIFLSVFLYLYLKKENTDIQHTIWIIKVFIILSLVQAITTMVIFLKRIHYRPGFFILTLRQTKEILTYAGVAFFCNFFQFLAYRMDLWFIDFFRDKTELGLYALASRLSQVLWIVPITVAAVITPFAVTHPQESMQKVKQVLRVLLNSYVLLGLLILLISPVLIPLVFGHSFSGTVFPFIILLPGTIFFVMTTVFSAYFAGIRRLDINLKISIACFLIIFVGDILMVPGLGKEGAAIASSIGYAISGFSSLYAFSKLSGWNLKELLLLRKGDITALKKNLLNK